MVPCSPERLPLECSHPLKKCELRNIPARRELVVPIEYKGFVFEKPLRQIVTGRDGYS